ncbi:hypothetical protein [Streptacidiphilus cavernicola]|uniref:Chaplin n=1 Tax=Streptacidiphilus cavernicola TaxID=3342716 RepID=A0ABV6W2M6_9ACTN
MRKIALLGMVGLALLGVAVGARAESGGGRAVHAVVADTGWGDPCGGLSATNPFPICGT